MRFVLCPTIERSGGEVSCNEAIAVTAITVEAALLLLLAVNFCYLILRSCD